MRFFLDTEFNGHGGELISIALISEWQSLPGVPHHKTYYEFYAAQKIHAPYVPWVEENVFPKLRTRRLQPGELKFSFQKFVERFPGAEIVCDWHVDAVHFCGLLSGEDYGASLDFPCTIRILKTPEGQPVSSLPHNALEDARALRDWYDSLSKAA